MPCSLEQTLKELRAQALSRSRRATRTADVVPRIGRLLASCRLIAVEERFGGVALRLAGETERQTPFRLTCLLSTAAPASALTTAEKAVVELLCEGLSLARIAQQRGVSANTVKTQVRQIFRKLNVDSRVALVRRWLP